MKKSLLALASGTFALGFAEFIMMGILPDVAHGLHVSIPFAGNFISAYAFGVCLGTLVLVFGRRVEPKKLLLAFVVIIIIGNIVCALAPNDLVLIGGRVLSGIPHGAYFGVATIAAKELADEGKQATAVAVMVLGQTIANMIGVPFGTLLSELISWRAAFWFIVVWSVGAFVLLAKWVPSVSAIHDAGLSGQFRFLKRPAPWLVLGAVMLGNTGLFTWWSYFSPWVTDCGDYPSVAVPALLLLAGFSQALSSQLGGRFADRTSPGKMAALGQAIGTVSLLLIFFFSHGMVAIAVLAFMCAFAMYFISSPQQLLMVDIGAGGGEMIAAAGVQIAYNAGNAFGALIGQAVLDSGAAYNEPSLAGVPFSLVATVLLVVFFIRYEREYLPSTSR